VDTGTKVFVLDGLIVIPIYLKILLHMYVLRTGELIVYKIRTSHVSQKATANVTWTDYHSFQHYLERLHTNPQ
jgi:hypothetical protein